MLILKFCCNKTFLSIFIVILFIITSLYCIVYLDDNRNNIERNSILATNDVIWEEFIDFLKREKKHHLLKHSYLQHRVEEFDNPDKHEILQNLVPLFIITPTYTRPLQLPELIRVSQSLKVTFKARDLYFILYIDYYTLMALFL